MTKSHKITIVRESAWQGCAGSMPVVIDDMISLRLANGESTEITLPKEQTECSIYVRDHTFRVVNLQQVNKIILQYQFAGIKCLIQYIDGNTVEAANKNPAGTMNGTIAILSFSVFILIWLFLQIRTNVLL